MNNKIKNEELNKNVVYSFLYNSCIHDSSASTISLHWSEEGAEKAMKDHKEAKRIEFDEFFQGDDEYNFMFGEHEDWSVEITEVLP